MLARLLIPLCAAALVLLTPSSGAAIDPASAFKLVPVGQGYVESNARQVIRTAGDRVYIEPYEEHWHGATPDRLMVHLALNEVDDQHVAAQWGDHVSDEEYNVARADTSHA